ncbi:unnamed protein product [marine sediment metagenome]|uniref:ZU5 domain-containing protein n=1 Tax=marine sediment metagenome TaxID=412755 RepID=X1RWW3_9ZZZZ
MNKNLLNSTEISGGIFKCEELSISQIGTNTVNVNLSSRIDLQPSEDYEFELGLWIIYEFEEEIVEERRYIRGGSGGDGVAAPKMNVPVDPVTGAVTSTTTLSADGATLTIPEGTIVKDEEGNILSTPIFMLHTPTTAESVGAIAAFEFGPGGITFEPPIDLVIEYDPADIPEGFSESDLVIRMWDDTASEWIDLETTVDTTAHTATAKVSHFTIFALFAAAPVAPPPTPTPTPSPTATPTPTPAPTPIKEFPLIPIVVIVAIVVAAILASLALAYAMRRKK